MKNNITWSKKHLSMMGKLSRKFENEMAEKIKGNYDYMFLPQSVCDRICIKNGKIFFIEIKKGKDKLKEKQKEFKKLVGNKYIIIRN